MAGRPSDRHFQEVTESDVVTRSRAGRVYYLGRIILAQLIDVLEAEWREPGQVNTMMAAEAKRPTAAAEYGRSSLLVTFSSWQPTKADGPRVWRRCPSPSPHTFYSDQFSSAH